MTYGGATPAILPLYSGFVNGDSAVFAHHATHVHHDRHVGQPGGELPEHAARARSTPTTPSPT